MRRIALLLIVSILVSVSAHAADQLDVVLKRIESKFKEIDTMTTGFIQHRKLSVFKHELEICGKIYMQQPDAFAWYVEKPFHSAMIIDGDIIKQWDEETSKTRKISLKKKPAFRAAVDQMRLWFSAQYAELRNSYSIKLVAESPVILEFRPKEEDAGSSFFSKVLITFREDEGYLKSIAIYEANGDSTVINFVDTVLNSTIDETVWHPGK